MKLLIFIYFLKFTFFTFYSRLYNYGKSDCYPVGPTFSREIHEYVWVSSTQLKKKKLKLCPILELLWSVERGR